MGNSSSLHQSWAPHSAVVSGAGSSSTGLTVPTRSATEGGSSNQSTPSEPPDTRGPESMSGDAVPASPDADVSVGRLQVADAEAWEWVTVRATRGFAAFQGKHSVELEVTPVGTRRRRAVGSTKSSGSEDKNTLRCITCLDQSSNVVLSIAMVATIDFPGILTRSSFKTPQKMPLLPFTHIEGMGTGSFGHRKRLNRSTRGPMQHTAKRPTHCLRSDLVAFPRDLDENSIMSQSWRRIIGRP